MPDLWIAVPVCLIVLAVAVGVRVARSWWKYRGDRVISCPENHRPAGVHLDAVHGALTAIGRVPELRLSACTRWPEHANCGQECLRQISASPEDCLVRNILVRWYAGKQCTSCNGPFAEIPLTGAKPAVLTVDKGSVEWSEIPADRLEETLAAAKPICFACHMGNLLVRTHPELALQRSGEETGH